MQKRAIAVLLGGCGRLTPVTPAISHRQLPALLRPAPVQTRRSEFIT